MSDNAPITEELRDAMKRYDNFDGTSRVVLGESNFDRLCDAIDATHANLERENAKLRKLVRQMHTCLTRPKVYAGANRPYLIATECPYFTQGVCDYNSCGFERRMRELGVEVPE